MYRGLADRLFGTPGSWNVKSCLNPDCGLLWLDPLPVEEDIHKAYRDYYTHVAAGKATRSGELYKRLGKLTPLHREQKKQERNLAAMPGGRLLEVGCGSGERLNHFQSLGWEAEGQEIDILAAERARSRGLTVHVGFLRDLALPDARFDAIMLVHVIEHAQDPLQLLRECRRLLAPGGRLHVITPNTGSIGHRRFRAAWRGLEPPRHLHLFNSSSLLACAARAGYGSVEQFTSAAHAEMFFLESWKISHGPRPARGVRRAVPALAASGFALWELTLRRWQVDAGEELVLMARE